MLAGEVPHSLGGELMHCHDQTTTGIGDIDSSGAGDTRRVCRKVLSIPAIPFVGRCEGPMGGPAQKEDVAVRYMIVEFSGVEVRPVRELD